MGRMKDFAIGKIEDLEEIDAILGDLECEKSHLEGQLEGIDRDLAIIEEEIELTLKRREDIEQETFADSAAERAYEYWKSTRHDG